MRYFIHIVTDQERIVDPDGGEFTDLASAREEASQSARDLMAEELRKGRPVPFTWLVQVADDGGNVLLTLPFARLVFNEVIAAQLIKWPTYDTRSASGADREGKSNLRSRSHHQR